MSRTTGTPIRAVCYVRVSTVEQAHGYSLETQETATVRLARELGAESIEVLRDTFTGTELDRPAMNRLRDQIRARQCQVVVMYDIDRFGRDLTDMLLVLREIDRAGIDLRFVNVGWENTPNGRILLQMRGAIAEFEHAQILERTRRGKTAKAAKGMLRTYAKPYGYTFDKRTDTLSVFEPEARWVRRMFEWCADEGMTTYRIAERLAALGVPGPKGPTWDYTQILRMLRSHTYIGRLVRKDERPEWAPISVPPIVDEAVWHRAQQTLAASKRFNRRRTLGEYLLQRLVHCGHCGGMLTVAATGPKDRRWTYYVCPRRYPRKFGPDVARCPARPIPTTVLDVLVWDVLDRVLADADGYVAGLREATVADRSPLETRIGQAEARLAQATRAIDRVHRAYARGVMDEGEHGRYVAEFQGEAEAARLDVEALGRALRDTARLETMADTLRSVAESAAADGANMSFAGRQKIVRFMISQVVIFATGEVHIHGALLGPERGVADDPSPLRSEAASMEKHAVLKLAREYATGETPAPRRPRTER